MQSVSKEWKENQSKRLVGESRVELSYTISDPSAQADASASDNGHVAFSNVAETVDGIVTTPVKYSTLEYNIWLLDGSFETLPDNPPQRGNGYIGDLLSSDTGDFAESPTIDIHFSETHDALIPGITIKWGEAYDEQPRAFAITAYRDTTVVANTVVEDNSSLTSFVELDMEGYNRISIQLLKWCTPRRRARVSDITLGLVKLYQKDDLVDFSHTLATDPLSASLPKAEISFKIINLDEEYNPENPSGASKYLIERQKISVRYGYQLGWSIEWISAGDFYLAEWETPQNGITATFRARDLLEFMSAPYTGTLQGSLYDIAISALNDAALPLNADGSVKWKIDPILRTIPAPELNEEQINELRGKTIAEILQLVANASCCVIYQEREGNLRIERQSSQTSDYTIDRNNSFANSEITLSKPLKSVNVNDGAYVLSVGKEGEAELVNNPLISLEQAPEVAQWVARLLKPRKNFTGEYRADPRLDALDIVKVINQFSESDVLITEIVYSYNGAFKGRYQGRAIGGI